MRRPRNNRKARFTAALALAEMTAEQFAGNLGVHKTHLHYVLKGERTSKKVNAAIDAFIAKHLHEVAA